MKTTAFIFLGLLLLINVACKKNNATKNYENLVGEWEWLSSFSGERGALFTPNTEGITKSIIFEKNKEYKIFRDGKKVESGIILIIEKSKNVFDFTIKLESNFILNREFTTMILDVNLKEDNTLSLFDTCSDCLSHKYEKK